MLSSNLIKTDWTAATIMKFESQPELDGNAKLSLLKSKPFLSAVLRIKNKGNGLKGDKYYYVNNLGKVIHSSSEMHILNFGKVTFDEPCHITHMYIIKNGQLLTHNDVDIKCQSGNKLDLQVSLFVQMQAKYNSYNDSDPYNHYGYNEEGM